MSKRYLALLAIAGGLGACTASHTASPPPPTVSYRVSGADLTQANANAAQYCRGLGSNAVFLSLKDGVATYNCGTLSRAVAATPYGGHSLFAPLYSGTTYPGTTVSGASAQH
jgi:hypothetical protein